MSSRSARRCVDTDVLIVGGGPAGIATSLALDSAGFVVCVLEQSTYETPRVGEHLAPDCQPFLERLRLWSRFLATAPIPSPGIRVAWDNTKRDERDYLFSPYGRGWNVDRRCFDATLAHAATAAGVNVRTATRLGELESRAGLWVCRLRDDGQLAGEQITARFLVDATGRATSVAKLLGAHRKSPDRLIGLCTWLAAGNESAPDDPRLLVEAVENGWWYAVQLPEKRLAGVLMTDRDLVPSRRDQAEAWWHASVEKTQHIAGRVRAYNRRLDFQIRGAHSFALQPAAGIVGGAGWLAAGDAAMAVDPLSSMGIVGALASGLTAATAIMDHISGDLGALEGYSDDISRRYLSYLADRSAVYGSERRWADRPFWRRRHASQLSNRRS
jgi:flavin-dependent dehydrogenase